MATSATATQATLGLMPPAEVQGTGLTSNPSSAQVITMTQEQIQRIQLQERLVGYHSVLHNTSPPVRFSQDDESFNVFKGIFRDIFALKDIPSNFRIKLSNCFEAVAFQSFDTIFEPSEKQYFYLMMQGEALIISSLKQYQEIQEYNNQLNRAIDKREAAAAAAAQKASIMSSDSNFRSLEVGIENLEQQQQVMMNDDEFFAQVDPTPQQQIQSSTGDYYPPEEERRSSMKDRPGYRMSIKEQRLSIKLRDHLVTDYMQYTQQQKEDQSSASQPTLRSDLHKGVIEDSTAKAAVKKGDEIKMIDITQFFGPSFCLTNAKWRPSYVIASRDNTLLIRAKVSDVENIMNQINSSASHKQLLQFLNQSIQSFNFLSSGSKDRIVRSFKERVFQPGQKLLKEGDPPHLCSAYIIREGHVALVSRINPYDAQFDQEGRFVGTKYRQEESQIASIGIQDKLKSGYMSRTTNTFQFAMKGKFQWVGEDVLVLGSSDSTGANSLYYSVIAVGKVVALEISRIDMLSKLPVQVVKWLEKGCLKRREWFFERLKDTNRAMKQVVKQAGEKEIFENETQKKEFLQMRSAQIQHQIMQIAQSSQQNDVSGGGNASYSSERRRGGGSIKSRQGSKTEVNMSKKSTMVLPQIINPRDAKLHSEFLRSSQVVSKFSNQSNTSRKVLPLKASQKGAETHQLSPTEIQNQVLSNISKHIDAKSIQKFTHAQLTAQATLNLIKLQVIGSRAHSTLGTQGLPYQSDLNSSYMNAPTEEDLQSQVGGANSVIFGVRHLSLGNMFEQSEIGEHPIEAGEDQEKPVVSVIPRQRQQFDRKIVLSNAHTLRPYVRKRRQVQMIPIFYQRNPNKTRNSVVASMSTVNFIQEEQKKAYQSNLDSLSLPGGNHHGSQSVLEGGDSVRYLPDYHQSQSELGLQPANSDFATPYQPYTRSVLPLSVFDASMIETRQSRVERRLEKKLSTEAKQKYKTFRVGLREIKDIDKTRQKFLQPSKFSEPETIVIRNQQLDENDQQKKKKQEEDALILKASLDESLDAEGHQDGTDSKRKPTPKLWEVEAKRNQIRRFTRDAYENSEQLRKALSYFNFQL